MNEKTRRKILIAEDEGPVARALDLKFHNLGYDSNVVGNGKDAINMLKDEKFDLIILDLLMPQMDGFQVLKQLKKMNIKTPVIVASNLSKKRFIAEAKELGAVDYFIKSETHISEVVEKANKFLNTKST